MIRKKPKKLIEVIKSILKYFFSEPRDIVRFIILIAITIILLIPVSCTVTVGGGTMDVNKKIQVENETKSSGTINMAYVKELNGNVLTYLLGKIIPEYKINKFEEITLDNETKKEYQFRENLDFLISLNSATKVAYVSANKDIVVKEEKIHVVYLDPLANTNLKIGDIITKINNQDVLNLDDITNIMKNNNFDDTLYINVIRNGKEELCEVKVVTINDEPKLGIYLSTVYEYETNPQIEFNFSNKELGPSGGLMLSLEIYNSLIDEDITKGRKIVGTGTINEQGQVGEVGGIFYKLKGAVKAQADIFFVPKENYEEANDYINKYDYDIQLVGVNTFAETLDYLKK